MRKKSGKAKTAGMRIHPEDLQDLKVLKSLLKMPAKFKAGDVVHELITLTKAKKILDPSFRLPLTSKQLGSEDLIQSRLGEYIFINEELTNTNRSLKRAIDILCEKHNYKYAEVMEMVKCQT